MNLIISKIALNMYENIEGLPSFSEPCGRGLGKHRQVMKGYRVAAKRFKLMKEWKEPTRGRAKLGFRENLS